MIFISLAWLSLYWLRLVGRGAGRGSGSRILLVFSNVHEVSLAQADGFGGDPLQGALLTLDVAEVTVQKY